jgi:GR25 family glycosyltransferase involved in LPS biosynthesis
MKVFVIHYKKLTDRKESILRQFQKHNITDFEFVEIDRDELDKQEPQELIIFGPNYPKPQMAITLSHIYAYRQIVAKYDSALILEDDAVLSDNFIEKLNHYCSQLPPSYDMLFIGDGCGLHIPKTELVPMKNVYKKGLYPTSWGGNGITRCTDSYVVSKQCAVKLCTYIQNTQHKINLPIDWWLNTAARDTLLNVYWAEPTIVIQGTESGIYSSSHNTYNTH